MSSNDHQLPKTAERELEDAERLPSLRHILQKENELLVPNEFKTVQFLFWFVRLA